MNTSMFQRIVSAAAVGATFTVLLWAGFGELEADDAALVPKIKQPTLAVDGAELSLSIAGAAGLVAGKEPVLELRMVNTNNAPARGTIDIVMTSFSIRSTLSRLPVMPATLWQEPLQFTLGPKEKKTVTLATRTKLPAAASVNVSLRERNLGREAVSGLVAMAENAIIALRFSTPAPEGSAEQRPLIPSQNAQIAINRVPGRP